MDGQTCLTSADFANALTDAATTAYKGVMKPVEGTILTVVRESAQVAQDVVANEPTMVGIMEAVIEEAKASLERTPSLLPVLADAGVVDAGGQGLVCIYEGICKYLRGEAIEAAATDPFAELHHAEAPTGEYNYDTQFIIQGQELNVAQIRERIAEFGDSVLVVGDEKTVKVHVHGDHPGEVLEYGIGQGDVTAVIIENMQLQYEEFVAKKASPTLPVPATIVDQPGDLGVVAVAAGDGLRQVFESLGVSYVVPGGQTMNPSTQDLVDAVNMVPRDKVILLPNNSNIIMAAEQARDLSVKQVEVVKTKTIPQGISAMLAVNYEAEIKENAALMLEYSESVVTLEVTQAVRTVEVNGIAVQEGQFIGLIDGDLASQGAAPLPVLMQLFEHIDIEDREIITIYYGADVAEHQADALADTLREVYDYLEVEILYGGQPHYHYIISVE